MAKQSKTGPATRDIRLSGSIFAKAVHLCRAASLIALFVAVAPAQAQSTPLPLALPSAIAFDAQGNLYIADTNHQVIRKLSASGSLNTLAGTGMQGFSGDNGPATGAELDSPQGLAVDGTGNLFIADTHNHRVREVAATTGVITTVAGTGAPGFSGDTGMATAARLDLPTALAVDSAGNLFVADTNNHRIRRIAASTGVITTVAGTGVEGFTGDGGPAIAASIDSPTGLAVDATGNLYLADTRNGRVRKVTAATGQISTVAGAGVTAGNLQAFSGDGGSATAAGLALPRGLILDAAGNLYIADTANQRIRRISATGTITTVAGRGTQTFAGDQGLATAASLDSPRTVALSPASQLTLADTGNQRIRQLDAGATPDIRTVASLNSAGAVVLSISGVSSVPYGTGSITATLATNPPATGSVTFLNTVGAVALGSAPLSATDAATFDTSGLAAGSYSILAIYAGDATHQAAQSSILTLSVTPLVLTATANSTTILYGQPVPALSGSLTGVLPQDAGKVTAIFTSSATTLSPPGAYPVAAALAGGAAANYTLSTTSGSLSIAKAPSLATLSASTSSPVASTPVTLSMQVAPTTSGVPTGSVTLLDATSLIATAPLSSGGAVFTTSSLALGTHSLTAAYTGDSNFLPSTSGVATVVVGSTPDFTLASTGPATQSVPTGSATTFNFSVSFPAGALASPIVLSVSGLPHAATASFNPSTIPPGGAVTSFALTIQTPQAMSHRPSRPSRPPPASGLTPLLVLLLPAVGWTRRTLRRGGPVRRSARILPVAAACIALASVTTGCGDRVNSASESATAATYTLTITGTATGSTGAALQHSTTVTLQML